MYKFWFERRIIMKDSKVVYVGKWICRKCDRNSKCIECDYYEKLLEQESK
jgi:hypothetical protein